MSHQITRIKRAYTALTPADRRQKAADEAFFDRPDSPLRWELLAHLRLPTKNTEPLPFADLTERGQAWVAERGLAPQEA